MKLLRSFLTLATLTAVASPAVAQWNPLTQTSSENVHANGGPLAPYGLYSLDLLQTPGTPTVDALCLDFLNGFTTNPAVMNFTRLDVAVTNSALFDSRTRFGSSMLDSYKKAAFLSSYFNTGITPSQTIDLNYAVWHLFTAGAPTPGRPGETAWTDLFTTGPTAGQWANIDLTLYFVVDDPGIGGCRTRALCGNQELLVSVAPEPASVLLLSTGLLGIVSLAGYRRRKNSK